MKLGPGWWTARPVTVVILGLSEQIGFQTLGVPVWESFEIKGLIWNYARGDP